MWLPASPRHSIASKCPVPGPSVPGMRLATLVDRRHRGESLDLRGWCRQTFVLDFSTRASQTFPCGPESFKSLGTQRNSAQRKPPKLPSQRSRRGAVDDSSLDEEGSFINRILSRDVPWIVAPLESRHLLFVESKRSEDQQTPNIANQMRRRQREGVHVLRLVGLITALAASLLAVAASPSIASASPLSESRGMLATARPPVLGKVAVAFEGASPDNSTGKLDESVVPSSLTIVQLTPPAPQVEEQRALKPAEVSATTAATGSRHSRNTAEDATAGPPFGGALVAVEATALLVGGATLVVLLMVKIKAHSASRPYEGRETQDPMLQSLLYSDMDYAAI